MTSLTAALALDALEAGPDTTVIARQVVESKRLLGKPAPRELDLADAITGVSSVDRMRGSSTLTVHVLDEDYALLDGGFFDADADGKLDAVDLNWPNRSRLWWRLTQANPNARGDLELVFMERAAVHMMGHHGPVKFSRAKKTRAEAVLALTRRVKAGGGIKLHSRDLKVRQPVEGIPEEKDDEQRRQEKESGLHRDEEIKFTNWDGSEYTLKPDELANAEKVCDACSAKDAGERATLAALCACIVEAPMFRNPRGGDSTSVGILQLLSSHLGGSVEARRDIAKVVTLFLEDGFTGSGGAIKLAKDHPDWSVGKIAQTVQGSAFPGRYDKVRDGAKQVLDAYGGVGGGSQTYRKQYNFEVGTDEDPHEDFWEAVNRWAEEVNWPFLIDGQDAYFDPETTLILQKPAAVVRRTDAAVLDWDYVWDGRHIATEMTLKLAIDPLELRAGQVLKLVGFGAASRGSTAKQPGRWLIDEIEAERGSIECTFTLKQPEKPKREPAPETGTLQDGGDPSSAGGEVAGSPKRIIDTVVIPIANEQGLTNITPQSVQEANARHGPTVSGTLSNHQGPPDERWAADMSNGFQPTPEMDALADALAVRFGFPVADDHVYAFPHVTHDGYEFEIGYKTMVGGNHFNHVHFGVVNRGGFTSSGGDGAPDYSKGPGRPD